MKIRKTSTLNFQLYIVSAILLSLLTLLIVITIKRSFEGRKLAEEYAIKNGINGHLNAAAAWQAVERGYGATILGSGKGDSSHLFPHFLEVGQRGEAEVLQAEKQIKRLLRVAGSKTLQRQFDTWHNGYEDLAGARPKIAANDISEEEWFYTATLTINNGSHLRNSVFAPQKKEEKILYLNNVMRLNITRLCEYAGRERALVGNMIASGKPFSREVSNEIEHCRSIVEESLNQLLILKDIQLTSTRMKQAIEDFEEEFLQSFDILMEEVFISSKEQEEEIRTSSVEITKRKAIFREYLSGIYNDLLNMSNQENIKTLARALNGQEDIALSEHLHVVGNMFETFSQVKKTLCRIQYLDTSGYERVRVDFDGNLTEIISDIHLQDRSDRSYFTKAIHLLPGEIYTSPLELNMEYGKIEMPYKPVIRLATPVFADEKSSGILVFNVLANTPLFLHKIAENERQGDYLLANQDGFYLNHPYELKEWGMMALLNKSHHNVRMDYPDVAEQILSGKEGSVPLASGKMLVYEPFFHKIDDNADSFWVLIKEVKAVEYPVDASTWFERATQAINRGLAVSNIAGDEADAVIGEMSSAAKRNVIMSFLIFVAAVSIFIFYIRWVRNRILKPVERLTGITQRIYEGDYTFKFEVNTKDEIGVLADNFNKMAERLTNEITERRRGEELIRKLSSAVEQNPATVIITDARGTIEYVNRKFTQLTGYTLDEVIEKNPRILSSGKTAPADYRNLWQTIVSGNEWHGKFCNKKKNGELYWESASISPVKDTEGIITHFVAVKEDITERMKAEKRLRAQHIVTQLLAESATIKEKFPKIIQAVCTALEWDLGDIWIFSQLDRVLHCSEIWHSPSIDVSGFIARSRGITLAPGVGLPGRIFSSAKAAWISDVGEDENFPRSSAALKEGLHGAFGFPILSGREVLGAISFYSREIRSPDRDTFDMMSSIGNQIGLFIKRKQAEALLKESEKRHRRLIQTAQDAIVSTDKNGLISVWNQSAEKLFGYSNHEIIGQPITTIIPETYNKQCQNGKGQIIRGGMSKNSGEPVEVFARTKKGIEIPIALSLSILQEGKGQHILTAIIRDMTERKKWENDVHKLSCAIEQSPVSVVITDTKGNIEYVNKKFTQITGYTSEETKGKNPRILKTDEKNSEEYKELWETITSGYEWKGEFSNKNKEGKIYWETASISPIKNDNGDITHFIAVKEDISTQKQMEAARERAHLRLEKINEVQQFLLAPGRLETKLKKITDSVVEMFDADFCRIWVIRPGDRCKSGCIHAAVSDGSHVCRDRDRCLHLLSSSGRYTHIDGDVHRRVPFGCYKIGLVAAKKERKFLISDVTHDSRIHNNEWASQLGLVSFAGYQLCPTGDEALGVMALFSKNTISGDDDELLQVLSHSTSQAIQASIMGNLIQDSKNKLEFLLFSIPYVIIELTSDNKINRWNEFAEKIFGIAASDAIGKTVSELNLQLDMDVISKKIALCRDNESAVWIDDSRYKRTDGSEGLLTVTINPIKNEDCKQTGQIILMQDITEHKKIENQLVQSQKLESIGQLAAGVAHEINTPTQFISDNTFFIQDAFNKIFTILKKYSHLLEMNKAGSVTPEMIREMDAAEKGVKLDYLTEEIPIAISETQEGIKRVTEIVK
ncbi:MAG: PAS domain S-box protein [Candidatus Scalindua sp.]|nr:PAS domain S-box protein [Candidatus Scalindua sp.]